MQRNFILSQFLLIAFTSVASYGLNMIEEAIRNGLIILSIGAIGILLSLRMAYKASPDYQTLNQMTLANKLASANKRNIYNHRICKLHESLYALSFDVRVRRVTETEFQTAEYQARVNHCRKLASRTGNPVAIARASSILNFIHFYLQRVEQAGKEPDAEFNIQVIDSTRSTKINTELGLLLSEVQHE